MIEVKSYFYLSFLKKKDRKINDLQQSKNQVIVFYEVMIVE